MLRSATDTASAPRSEPAKPMAPSQHLATTSSHATRVHRVWPMRVRPGAGHDTLHQRVLRRRRPCGCRASRRATRPQPSHWRNSAGPFNERARGQALALRPTLQVRTVDSAAACGIVRGSWLLLHVADELRAQPAAGAHEQTLQRFDADAHQLRGLEVGQFLVVLQHQRFALTRGNAASAMDTCAPRCVACSVRRVWELGRCSWCRSSAGCSSRRPRSRS